MFLSKILIHLCTIIHYTVEEKKFYCYYLQDLSTIKILKCHVKGCFKMYGK